jgi:hypothetical protein
VTGQPPTYGQVMLGQLRQRIVAHIDTQREMGWRDFHPEDICHRCGGVNVSSWWVDSDRFNAAMGPHGEHQWQGIVCPGCFVQLHEQATGLHCTWTLVPDRQATFRPLDGDPDD